MKVIKSHAFMSLDVSGTCSLWGDMKISDWMSKVEKSLPCHDAHGYIRKCSKFNQFSEFKKLDIPKWTYFEICVKISFEAMKDF